jgi:hypothetical protein
MMDQNGMYSEEYGENGYMEQEEEWEREGLLDPAWEKQQKKASKNNFHTRSPDDDERPQKFSFTVMKFFQKCE